MKISSKKSRLVCLVGAFFFALPLPLGAITSFLLWTSPLLFLDILLSGKTLPLFSGLGAAVLVLVALRHRWFCRWICPPGLLCDMVSKKSRARIVPQLPRLGGFAAVAMLITAVMGLPLLGFLDPIAIFYTFLNAPFDQSFASIAIKMTGFITIVALSFMMPGIWCNKLCPLGGLQDVLTSVKRKLIKKENVGLPFLSDRRVVLGALAGLGFTFVFKKSAPDGSGSIRPPAALPVKEFQATCIRCGNCSKVCPTNIILSSFDLNNITGLLTPYVSFANSYCLPNCVACGTVCPSGAINRFKKTDKKSLIMGTARIRVEECLLTQQKECDRCRFYCEYEAITIVNSNVDFNAWPEVNKKQCVGCGACVVACPVNIISVEPLS
jgi:ferredoxin-type protein NapF